MYRGNLVLGCGCPVPWPYTAINQAAAFGSPAQPNPTLLPADVQGHPTTLIKMSTKDSYVDEWAVTVSHISKTQWTRQLAVFSLTLFTKSWHLPYKLIQHDVLV